MRSISAVTTAKPSERSDEDPHSRTGLKPLPKETTGNFDGDTEDHHGPDEPRIQAVRFIALLSSAQSERPNRSKLHHGLRATRNLEHQGVGDLSVFFVPPSNAVPTSSVLRKTALLGGAGSSLAAGFRRIASMPAGRRSRSRLPAQNCARAAQDFFRSTMSEITRSKSQTAFGARSTLQRH